MKILTGETQRILAERKQKQLEETTWTDTHEVYLGNGAVPPVVVIPPNERDAPWLSIYCIDALVDVKQIYQVQNNNASITFDNSGAAILYKIGKPPGGKYYQFTPDQPSAQALSTGGSGALPSQIAQVQQQFITLDRRLELRLYKNDTGLIVNLWNGAFRIDNQWSVWEGGAFWDAADYVPSTASMSVYVLVAIDINNTPQVTVGTEFATGAGSVAANAPRDIPNGSMQLGTVLLHNGMTDFVDSDFFYLQDIPTGINESSIIDDAEFALTDDDGESLTDDLGELLLGTS